MRLPDFLNIGLAIFGGCYAISTIAFLILVPIWMRHAGDAPVD